MLRHCSPKLHSAAGVCQGLLTLLCESIIRAFECFSFKALHWRRVEIVWKGSIVSLKRKHRCMYCRNPPMQIKTDSRTKEQMFCSALFFLLVDFSEASPSLSFLVVLFLSLFCILSAVSLSFITFLPLSWCGTCVFCLKSDLCLPYSEVDI